MSLKSLMSFVGLNYFSRKAATGFGWQNHQEIEQTGETYHIKGESEYIPWNRGAEQDNCSLA